MSDQNVLIVGSGGREHAIVRALSKSSFNPTLYAYSTCWNPGLLSLVGRDNMRVASSFDNDAILDFTKANHINYVVIGPEAVLATGLPDLLRANHIGVIGPNRGLAKIETSKKYCRDLMYSCGLDKYSPKYLLVEDDHHSIENILKSEISTYLKNHGYQLMYKTVATCIYQLTKEN